MKSAKWALILAVISAMLAAPVVLFAADAPAEAPKAAAPKAEAPKTEAPATDNQAPAAAPKAEAPAAAPAK